jgi:hypothetical protein
VPIEPATDVITKVPVLDDVVDVGIINLTNDNLE